MFKDSAITVLIAAVVILAGMWVLFSNGVVPYGQRAVSLPGEVASQVMTADNAIADYEWFKSQEAFINQCLTDEKLTYEQWQEYLERLPEDLTTWTAFMSKEEASLRASYNAHQKLTNKAIEDYNARSSMVNRSIFKDLPTNIARSTADAFELILGE